MLEVRQPPTPPAKISAPSAAGTSPIEYSADTADTVLASEMHQPQASPTATLERPSEQAPHDAFGAAPYVPEQDSSIADEDERQGTPEVVLPDYEVGTG